MPGNDLSAIVNVINLYATAVDTHSRDLFDQVFTPDIAIDFGGRAAVDSLAAQAAAGGIRHLAALLRG